MDRHQRGTLSLDDFLDSLSIAQQYSPYDSVDLVTAFNAMAVERSRGGHKGLGTVNMNAEEDGLTYHEFIAAAMINRVELTDERVALAFHCLDMEKLGALTPDGIRLSLGDDLPLAVINTMIMAAAQGTAFRGGSSITNTGSDMKGGENDGIAPALTLPLPSFINNWKHFVSGGGIRRLSAPINPLPSILPSSQHQQQQKVGQAPPTVGGMDVDG
jgi:hypothetical protein